MDGLNMSDLNAYKGVIFGKSKINEPYAHDAGFLFIAEGESLTDRFKKDTNPNSCVAATFKFVAKKPWAYYLQYLQGIFEKSGVRALSINTMPLAAETKVIDVFHDEQATHKRNMQSLNWGRLNNLSVQNAFHLIEFKFSKADADLVRETILSIDEALEGQVWERAQCFADPAFKVAA